MIVLRYDRSVRFPRWEARRLWQGHRRHAHVAQDRECPNRAEQQTQARRENNRYVHGLIMTHIFGSFDVVLTTVECGEM